MVEQNGNDGRRHGVVVAIRRDDGKFLCIRRAMTVVRAPGKVCFPGGMIEPGESQADAVRREMKEELGIDVEPARQCWRHDLANSDLTLWGWIAEWTAGELRAAESEVAEIIWLSGEEACAHPDAIGTNRAFVNCLSREFR